MNKQTKKTGKKIFSVSVCPGSPGSQVMWVLLHTEGKLLVFSCASFQGMWEQDLRQAVPEAGKSDSAPHKLPVATPECKFQALTIQNAHKALQHGWWPLCSLKVLSDSLGSGLLMKWVVLPSLIKSNTWTSVFTDCPDSLSLNTQQRNQVWVFVSNCVCLWRLIEYFIPLGTLYLLPLGSRDGWQVPPRWFSIVCDVCFPPVKIHKCLKL